MRSKKHPSLNVKRNENKIIGDPSRVITCLHMPGERGRVHRIIQRILNLPDMAAQKLLSQTMTSFSGRHKNLGHVFERHLNEVKGHIPRDVKLSHVQRALIGAYFTKEYAIESAALFNPSIVPHPDQSGLNKGSLRFVMSLRATGEGHISSIVFRSGVLDRHNAFHFDTNSDFVETPDLISDRIYNRSLFQRKLNEMWAGNEVTDYVFSQMAEEFTYNELMKTMGTLYVEPQFSKTFQDKTFEIICWLADSNYEVCFHPDHHISERVIFPVSRNESRGIEDARFVQFLNDRDEPIYYATYTAYNGVTILPQLIETKDFVKFNVLTLNGKAIQNKGMALFPRKIGGHYVMLSRQDGENIHIMFSDNLHFWQESKIIQEPKSPWEFIQIGNCGSPLETDKGWLVLTHGVGPMRQYCIGAILLDLDNPSRIIAHLDEPLLAPLENEREGYVPNVVYSCGAIIHNKELVIPYAMSDSNSGTATVGVRELIGCMHSVA
ncbi:MAG: glycoside hydrolase family 130 protein [Phycisphaerae bacterium]|nr:glycoside hydrolase family 130 protein [Phycisphaerae bacterium]